jgi:hypothetical protein
MNFDCAGDANDFSLEDSNQLVSRHFRTGRNEPSESLIGVFSSEINKCSPEWAGRDGKD